MIILFFAAVMAIIPAFIAENLWTRKGGASPLGFLLGLLLGWIGVLIAALASPNKPDQGPQSP